MVVLLTGGFLLRCIDGRSVCIEMWRNGGIGGSGSVTILPARVLVSDEGL